jgi:hypothetical protein
MQCAPIFAAPDLRLGAPGGGKGLIRQHSDKRVQLRLVPRDPLESGGGNFDRGNLSPRDPLGDGAECRRVPLNEHGDPPQKHRAA